MIWAAVCAVSGSGGVLVSQNRTNSATALLEIVT
jgi:hypothetical protein